MRIWHWLMVDVFLGPREMPLKDQVARLAERLEMLEERNLANRALQTEDRAKALSHRVEALEDWPGYPEPPDGSVTPAETALLNPRAVSKLADRVYSLEMDRAKAALAVVNAKRDLQDRPFGTDAGEPRIEKNTIDT